MNDYDDSIYGNAGHVHYGEGQSPVIDDEELSAAENEAETSTDTYTHVFKKPFTYDNKTYNSLSFDWDSLTGADSLNIEAELNVLGRVVVTEEFSAEYIIRFAAKCCTEKIGSDAFGLMRLKDYKRIKGRARAFLMAAD